MTTFNTGNPIGSTDARDRLDNSENMDILENSTTLNEHPDRLGTIRKTRKGMELEHDNQIAAHKVEHDAQIAAHEAEHDAQISAHETEHDNQMLSFENDFDSRLAGMAFTRVGTFTAGATLTDMRQTLLWEVSQGGDGREYGWTGSFLPSGKVVSAGTSPAPVSAGNWVDRTDDKLRSDLLGDNGLEFVSGKLLANGTKRSLYNYLNDFKISALNVNGVFNDGVVDCRAGLESLILTCSLLTHGATIYFPKGKYLLNSYSSDSTLQATFGQILPLRSNVHIEFDDNAELIVGPYFDDKTFTLFCGLDNGVTPASSSNTNNVHVYGGTISFSGSVSKMRTGYKLRVGFQLGKTSGTSITNVTFKDGDLSNCVAAGYGTIGEYHTVRGCRFLNLVQDADTGSSPNIDFTACYCNAEQSIVTDCHFHNSSRRGGEIAAAVELHKSNSAWSGGSINGYTRGGYIVAVASEYLRNQGSSVCGVKGVVTNRFIDLWIGSGCTIADAMISKNNIRTMDRDGTMTDVNYYGACGLIGTAGGVGDDGSSENIVIKDNIFSVSQTVVGVLSSCLSIGKDISGWSVIDNQFSARHLIWNDTTYTRRMNSVTIKGNRFNTDAMDVGSEFAVFNVAQMIYCDIDIKMAAPVALSKVLTITAGLSGSGNTVKVHDENTSQIGVPVLINDIFLQGATNKTEYPEDMTFFVPASAGVYPFSTNAVRQYHKYATIIDKKTLPTSAALGGSLTPNAVGQMGSLGYYPTNLGGSSYVGRVRLSSF